MTFSAQASSSTKTDDQEFFIGLAPLMRKALLGIDLKPLGAKFIDYAAGHPDDAHALMNLANILFLTGHRDIALATQMEALQIQQVYRVPAIGQPKLRLLALVAPGDLMANTPLEFLLEDAEVSLDLLYIGAGVPAVTEIPEHDVMFVAVGEGDENRLLLEELESLVRAWPQPVLNSPRGISLLARDSACRLLSSVPGLSMPDSVRIDRPALEEIGNGKLPLARFIQYLQYPIILRPVGSHAGQGLKKIDTAAEIADYLQAVAGAEFYMASFIDYRSKDGLFRKYRIMLIEGKPYISHMAISSHWMIHYLNAGMVDSAEKRAEEENFMTTFEADFARRHQQACEAIAARTGLDYVGIDCGETPDGRLLVFEVDSDMIVHAMDPIDLFPYKRPAMRKLFAAFQQMLFKAAAAHPV